MNEFEIQLQLRLQAIQDDGLYRELRQVNTAQQPRIQIGQTPLLNFSSNDYLGFASHPAIKEAAALALKKFGAGSGASRLISGSLAPHHELEEAIAAFKGLPRALTFSSGYAAALGAISSLMGKEDIIILDQLVHASIIDAARLSGAKIRVFKHNNLNELEDRLRWADGLRKTGAPHSPPHPQTLVVTESLFSMDGDMAPLNEIVALKNQYGAWLMVDEAHATGVYGPNRRGLVEQYRLTDQIEIQMGTLGKALGSSGGFICGSSRLIDLLVNRARSFIFSTAPAPAAAGAAFAAIQLVQTTEGELLRQRLWSHVESFCQSAASLRIPMPLHPQAPIIPLAIGEENAALSAAATLLNSGIFIPAIRYPTVKRGSARLRLTLNAAHAPGDLDALIKSLAKIPWPAISKPQPGNALSNVPHA